MHAWFRYLAGLVLTVAVTPVLAIQQAAQADPWPPPGAHAVREPGVTAPKVLTQVKPKYTPEARSAHIEGNVRLDCVVGVDGAVTAVRVSQSLDAVRGLDDEAVKAIRQWKFTPGSKDGVPVPVLVTVDDAGWRIRLSYPSGWLPRPGATASPAVGRLHGGAVSVFQARLQPKVSELNQPIASSRLQEYAGELTRSLVARSAELRTWGQVRLSGRYWTWVAVHLPSPDPGREAFDMWSFNTTMNEKTVQVTCYVSMPKGSGPGETDAEARSASALFVEMLKRLVVEPVR